MSPDFRELSQRVDFGTRVERNLVASYGDTQLIQQRRHILVTSNLFLPDSEV